MLAQLVHEHALLGIARWSWGSTFTTQHSAFTHVCRCAAGCTNRAAHGVPQRFELSYQLFTSRLICKAQQGGAMPQQR